MNINYLAIAGVLAFTFSPLAANAGQVSGMDWKSAEVSAVGIGVVPDRVKNPAQGRALACRAAKVDGLRNLLETVQGVRVDSATLVKDAMVESDLVRTTVTGIVKGASEVSRRVLSDGSCEVTLAMPVAGDLFSAVISEDEYRQETRGVGGHSFNFSNRMMELANLLNEYGFITQAHASSVPEVVLESQSQLELAKKLHKIFEGKGDKVAAVLLSRAINDYETAREVTGIVIDASNVGSFQPAALPWIRDDKGEKLYPNADTPYEIVRSSMPVSYDFDVDTAVRNKRVATKPAVLKAVATYKERSSDLMLDEAGKKEFLNLIQKGNVNENARIMIVVSD